MKDSWLCRDYESGDEYQILSLYKQVTGGEMSLDFWKWKFERGPFGKGIIKLMFDGDKLIGHYSVIPMNIEIQSWPVRAVFSLNTLTHPDYQGQGIFTCLARETYKECQHLGFRLVYGFPNGNAYHGLTKRLGWQGFGKMNLLHKGLQEEAYRPQLSKHVHKIYQIERFGEDINTLWHEVEGEYNVIVPRSKEFLNWRYVEHPQVNYPKYVTRDNSGKTVGYIVLKTFRAENETIGHIVDILSMNDEDAIRGLIRTASDYFLDKGIGNISCWMQGNYSCVDVMKAEGFIRKEQTTPYPYFGVGAFGQVDKLGGNIKSSANWYLTMGDDCDVF